MQMKKLSLSITNFTIHSSLHPFSLVIQEKLKDSYEHFQNEIFSQKNTFWFHFEDISPK